MLITMIILIFLHLLRVRNLIMAIILLEFSIPLLLDIMLMCHVLLLMLLEMLLKIFSVRFFDRIWYFKLMSIHGHGAHDRRCQWRRIWRLIRRNGRALKW